MLFITEKNIRPRIKMLIDVGIKQLADIEINNIEVESNFESRKHSVVVFFYNGISKVIKNTISIASNEEEVLESILVEKWKQKYNKEVKDIIIPITENLFNNIKLEYKFYYTNIENKFYAHLKNS